MTSTKVRYFVALVEPAAQHTDAKGFGLVFPALPGGVAMAATLIATVQEAGAVLRNLADLGEDIEAAALDKAGLSSLDDVDWSEYVHGAIIVLVPYEGSVGRASDF